jgi:AcrR family transcriptional regulator
MAAPVKPRRRYDSTRRRQQALATRQAVLDAARASFLERGYASTTIVEIALRAGVSAESVYAIFGTKRALLVELVDVSIAGGVGARPVLDQAWVEEIRNEPDVRRRLRILAANGAKILERRASIDEVVRGAATTDPEIAALWRRGRAERREGQRGLLRIVARGGGLRKGLALGAAADILYAVGSPETYRSLVVDRGWSPSRFERWYGDALERLLL